jgi:hypothetical protein
MTDNDAEQSYNVGCFCLHEESDHEEPDDEGFKGHCKIKDCDCTGDIRE